MELALNLLQIFFVNNGEEYFTLGFIVEKNKIERKTNKKLGMKEKKKTFYLSIYGDCNEHNFFFLFSFCTIELNSFNFF